MGHHFMHTVHHGGAQYLPTGRGFATARETLVQVFRCFATSHMKDGFEVALFLLLSTGIDCSAPFYICTGISIVSWTVAPFLFNPKQFDSPRLVAQDTCEWLRWFCGSGHEGQECWVTWATRGLELRRCQDSTRWLLIPTSRLLALLATSVLLTEVTTVQPVNSPLWWRALWLLRPPFWHLILCLLLLAPFDRLCDRRFPLPLTALLGLTLSTVEVMVMDTGATGGNPVAWRCVLFHRYIFVRFMLDVSDFFAFQQPGGRCLSGLHSACRTWALSVRFLRDAVLGLVLAAFCLFMSMVPGLAQLHDCFLFRRCMRSEESVRHASARLRLMEDRSASTMTMTWPGSGTRHGSGTTRQEEDPETQRCLVDLLNTHPTTKDGVGEP